MGEAEQLKRKTKQLAAMPDIGRTITEYCIENDIKNVLFLDRSARPAYVPFKTYWDSTQNAKERPNIYFLSPKLLEGTGADEEAVALFKKEQPKLSQTKDSTLVFDVCVKDGLTIHNVGELLEKAGIEDTYSMVTAVHKDRKQYVNATKTLYDNHSLGCHLFGSPLQEGSVGVDKQPYSLLATKKIGNQAKINANRRELKEAVKQYLD